MVHKAAFTFWIELKILGLGVRVGCLLTLKLKHGIEIRNQFMCLLCLGLGINSFKLQFYPYLKNYSF